MVGLGFGLGVRRKGIGRGGVTDRVEVSNHLAERVHRDEPHLGALLRRWHVLAARLVRVGA